MNTIWRLITVLSIAALALFAALSAGGLVVFWSSSRRSRSMLEVRAMTPPLGTAKRSSRILVRRFHS